MGAPMELAVADGTSQSRVTRANGLPIASSKFTPVGAHAQDTTISAATTLTPEAGATKLLIQSTGQKVRMTLDGTAPTASLGFVLVPDDPPVLIENVSLYTIKVIEATAGGAVEYQWGS